ncbi:MAG: M48 family metalloprotease [Gammaproteobacteria bacterium]|nr:M48 family metalloprotease [Gammaproteobacteria bacterium]
MKPEEFRCENDRGMFDVLVQNREVVRVNEHIKHNELKGPQGLRRRLLGTSVRLSRNMAPDVHRQADECFEMLDMNISHELYVYAGSQYNAACFKPENDRLFVIFSSGLLEAFTGSELRFVIGHEFGHYVFHHHDIPIGYLLNSNSHPDPRLALDLFAWSRYAEISADRAGAHCARDFNAVAKALFKLASGLHSKIVEFNFEDFLQQVDDMQFEDAQPGHGAPEEDWFSTHPFSPMRVKALKFYHDSEFVTTGGTSKEELEVEVQGLMSLMEPSYLEGRTDTAEAMRRLLFAAAIAVADANDGISKQEIEVFEKFFGPSSFRDNLSIEKLKAELPNRIAAVIGVASIPQRMQVLRDLCIVAKIEGQITDSERSVLDSIAEGLGVSRSFVCHSIESSSEPD